MTEEQHAKRHEELHKALDELVANWIESPEHPTLSKNTVLDLIVWSSKQQDGTNHQA